MFVFALSSAHFIERKVPSLTSSDSEINALHGDFMTSVFIKVNHSSISPPPEDVSGDVGLY